MAKPFANSGDRDQTLHSVASDLGLHCLPIILLGVSRLEWVKKQAKNLHFDYNVVSSYFPGKIQQQKITKIFLCAFFLKKLVAILDNIIWATPSQNASSGICIQQRPRSACASAQSDQGLHCPQQNHWILQTV